MTIGLIVVCLLYTNKQINVEKITLLHLLICFSLYSLVILDLLYISIDVNIFTF